MTDPRVKSLAERIAARLSAAERRKLLEAQHLQFLRNVTGLPFDAAPHWNPQRGLVFQSTCWAVIGSTRQVLLLESVVNDVRDFA